MSMNTHCRKISKYEMGDKRPIQWKTNHASYSNEAVSKKLIPNLSLACNDYKSKLLHQLWVSLTLFLNKLKKKLNYEKPMKQNTFFSYA